MKAYANYGVEKTELLFGQNDVFEKWKQCAINTKKEINIYADSHSSLETIGFKNYLEILRRLKEKGVRIRYLTEISKTNLEFCKSLMTIISDLRHLDGIRGAFGVTDREFLATATLHKKKPESHAIYSNASQLVEVQRRIFDTLWNKSISAERKLEEIELDREAEFFEVINDPQRTTDILMNLANSIKGEALLLLPHGKSMTRLHQIGFLDKLIEAAKRKAIIRVVSPIDDENDKVIQFLRSRSPNINILNGTQGFVSLLIVDNSKFFIAEVHEDIVKEFSKTLGFGLYSNSVAVIQSIRMFFELLWRSEEVNKKLLDHEKLQAEFINIASHELKTPIQSILTYSELWTLGEEPDQYVEAIKRNALRLKQLSNNLLDLTKIQSNKVVLNKSSFDLIEALSSIVEDFRNQIKNRSRNSPSIEIFFTYEDSFFIEADKEKIIQVISNLIHNALKFTEEGYILIKIMIGTKNVTISVKDTGLGIDSSIMPYLFTKFNTTNHGGTGVGLYVSKNLVEMHGGKIWARNNINGKGTTFFFSLPIKDMKNSNMENQIL